MKKRSITSPHGHQINITLEAEFWAVIDASIAEGPQSFAGFISQREHEFMEDGQTGELAAYLREWCSARANVEKNINDKTSHVTLGQNDFSWIWQAHQTNNATPVSAATTHLSIFRQHIVSGGTVHLKTRGSDILFETVTRFDKWVSISFPNCMSLYPRKNVATVAEMRKQMAEDTNREKAQKSLLETLRDANFR